MVFPSGCVGPDRWSPSEDVHVNGRGGGDSTGGGR